MKHRGSSKVKYQHRIILGLRTVLETIALRKEITTIIPGVIKPRKASSALTISVQYDTPTGLKCIAKSGSAVQELFIVTSDIPATKAHLKQYAAK